ncbi:MAG: methylmalonyl Co-A mutase-associated GTPase MeaB [Acidimicrobiia bacterium]
MTKAVAAASAGDLVEAAVTGERGAVARLLSMIETGGPDAHTAVGALYSHTGSAYVVGITGAPGSGKSTLTDRLVGRIRDDGDEVGVLAIDPTSPFSGGAILGDRIRMQDHATDPGVFIRSMATRGHLGGLALATPQAVRVLDAAGKDWVLIETVGVGQVEVEIAGAADTTIVVVNPGWGDAIQANKAGLLEIADVFAVNKADRPGAAEAVRDLEMMLDLAGDREWRPPVVETVAVDDTGTDTLLDAVATHRRFLESDGRLDARRHRRTLDELRRIVVAQLDARADDLCSGQRFETLAQRVVERDIDPYAAAAELLGTEG